MFAALPFAGAAFAGVVGVIGPLPPPPTDAGIWIGGLDVRARIRVAGVTIHDILNDAANTASLTIEGEAPAVGQAIEITVGQRLLFGGTLQTIDQAYESRPDHLAWRLTAIDDTAAANARRPFGTWVATSATIIAQTLTATYAPGFAPTGIVAGLPPVTIVFDGADTFIACLTRLATAIGGYCKIENRTVYLFQVDATEPPATLNDTNRFLADPPITRTTDSSQLRTRVYGKGYGETVQADLAAGEAQFPIEDGATFPRLGGTLIASLTADGAQSEHLAFTGVDLGSGGSLVGPGAGPSTAPRLELAAGPGVTEGYHTVSIAFRTAAGVSRASPAGAIMVPVVPPPAAAPVAAAAVDGTGPDSGSHEYAVSFVTSFGETLIGPVSNAVTTSTAEGQLPPPGPPNPQWPALQGAGLTDGYHAWRVTFVNANGETEGGGSTGYYGPVQSQLTGQTQPVQPGGTVNGFGHGKTVSGGALQDTQVYTYYGTYTTALGETTVPNHSYTVQMQPGQNAADVPLTISPDPRVTGRKLYRLQGSGSPGFSDLCATIANNTQSIYEDTIAYATIQNNPPPPTQDSTAFPGTPTPFNRIQLNGIPTGPAGTTARKLYRAFNHSEAYYLVATLSDNTSTSYLDQSANNFTRPTVPTSNTSGIAKQKVPLSEIPIGPPGTTERALYRRFNGAGPFKLVKRITNNTATTTQDTTKNVDLGAASLTAPTAVGHQIRVEVPIGPAAVTARELYMSPATDTVRRLIGVFPENTTTTWTIATPDAQIPTSGGLEPSADTSGLQQPQGQVNPGATVLPVAASLPFRPAGGWVTLAGGQVVKHTGISGNTLTGIPAEGSGAITTTVLYGQQAIPAPMLTGVTGLTRPMAKGSAVSIWIQRDDVQAQVEQAARTGGDGIVEFLIVDARRGVDSLAARCDADLAQFSRPIVTVTYATRDLRTRSGKTIAIRLPSQGIDEDLTIQDVTITEIGLAPNLAPRFTVRASNVRFSLEDTLRRLIAGGQTTVNK